MANNTRNYPCADCGKPRQVRIVDIERGERVYCRKCAPKHTAESRSKSLKEVRKELETPIDVHINRLLTGKRFGML